MISAIFVLKRLGVGKSQSPRRHGLVLGQPAFETAEPMQYAIGGPFDVGSERVELVTETDKVAVPGELRHDVGQLMPHVV